MAKVNNGGRPPKPVKVVKKVMAEQILSSVDEIALWKELLSAERILVTKTGGITVPDYATRLDALKYLTDRRDGKAPQAISQDGPFQIKVTVERI